MKRNLDSITVKGQRHESGRDQHESASTSPSVSQKIGHFGQELRKIKYLPRVPRMLSHGEKIAIKLLVGLIVISCIALGIQYYLRHTIVVAKVGGDYVEGIVGEPKTVNPLFADSSNEVDKSLTGLVFRGLMKFNPDLSVDLDLAERFEQSEDMKEYTFYLKHDVKWHDYSRQQGIDQYVTADDVVFTIQAIQNPQYGSPLRSNFNGVRVEKIDNYSVRFSLDDAFAPFLANMTVGIVPKHIWQHIPPTNAPLAEANLKPIGNGPYRFKSLEKDKLGVLQSFKLERFADYYGDAPYIDTITFMFYQNSDLLLNAYASKKVDGVNFLLPEQKKRVLDDRDMNFHSINLSTYHGLFFNEINSKPLQDKQVRISLSHATDRERIVAEALNDQGIPVFGPILPGFIGFNPELQKYEFDVGKAESILHEAGWQDTNGNNTRDKGGVELEITLRTTDFPEHQKTASLIQKQWERIGVKLNVEEYDSSILQQRFIRQRDYEMLLFGEIVGHDPDPFVFWHSTQRRDPGLNLTSFNNRSADNLLDEARRTDVAEERTTKYIHFQNIIAEEIPAIFLYAPTYLYGQHPDIRGFDVQTIATPSERFLNVGDWYIKTQREWVERE
jgi:peptide/nickel transport system substrate-binding protein